MTTEFLSDDEFINLDPVNSGSNNNIPENTTFIEANFLTDYIENSSNPVTFLSDCLISDPELVDDNIDLNNIQDSNIVSIADELSSTYDECIPFITVSDSHCGEQIQINLHNGLDGLQGGIPSERYHITLEQWDAVRNSYLPSLGNPFVTLSQLSNLRGPKGDTGETGEKGEKGDTGNTGSVGPQGSIGPTGAQGPIGPTGATGLTGATGPQGIQGIQGIQGLVGPRGIQGLIGLTGPQGIQGEPGEKGETGDQGVPGQIGATGPIGLQGIQGVKGDKGEPGAKGDTGATGATGIQGPIGPTGLQGATGATGLTGAQGIQGPIGLTGPIGPRGLQGLKGDDGNGINIKGSFDDPSELPASGEAGDAYLIDGDLWVWNGTAWSNVGNIQGPQGIQGEDGPQGLTGATGAQGIQGLQGEQGLQGIQGPIGPQGLTGGVGATGATGATGPQGIQGIQGPQGPQGPQGTFESIALVHRYGTFTADADTALEHTSNFTYGVNAPNVGTLMHFGANGYGTQFNTNYGNGTQLHFRSKNGDNQTWNPWFKIWSDADFIPTVQASANTVVRRDANGYIFNNYINTTDDINGNPALLGYIIGKNPSDGYHRSYTADAVKGWLGLGSGAYNDKTRLWAVSHPSDFYISNSWDGTYWQLTSNHGSPVNVGRATTADNSIKFGGWNSDYSNGGTTLAYLFGGDGTFATQRFYTAGPIRAFLGLGDSAYTAETLDSVATRGNSTYQGIGIMRDGVGNDPYGAMSVTRGQAGNYSYYGMTRSGQIGWGMGIDTSNRLVFGTGSSGYSGTFVSIPHTFDASGNATHTNNVGVGGTLTVAGPAQMRSVTINNGSVFYQYNADNSLAVQSDMRGDTLHQYTYRTSDGAALSYKANWYNGTAYHSWTTDTAGFVANAKLTAISAGDGSVTYGGALETRGPNAGITFHYPGAYAASLWMAGDGTLVWNGTKIQASTIYATGIVRSGSWLYANGASGWYNETYGGGMYMQDSTWVRTYNGKALWSDSTVRGDIIQAYSGFRSENIGGGLIGVYSATAYQEVFSMGQPYRPALDGSAVNNSYGILWTHSNVGGISIAGLEHQALFTQAGATNTAIGNGIWTRGNISSNQSVYAQTMYSAGGFYDTSDKRLKTEVDLTFNTSNIKVHTYYKDGKLQTGYYAQDVQSVMAHAVDENNDGYLTLNYTQVLVNKVAALEEDVKQLQNKLREYGLE